MIRTELREARRVRSTANTCLRLLRDLALSGGQVDLDRLLQREVQALERSQVRQRLGVQGPQLFRALDAAVGIDKENDHALLI